MKNLKRLLQQIKEAATDKTKAGSGDLMQHLVDNPNSEDFSSGSTAELAALATVGAYFVSGSPNMPTPQAEEPAELEKGIEVEMEHMPADGDLTTKRRCASMIARRHIEEDPQYYEKLFKYVEGSHAS